MNLSLLLFSSNGDDYIADGGIDGPVEIPLISSELCSGR